MRGGIVAAMTLPISSTHSVNGCLVPPARHGQRGKPRAGLGGLVPGCRWQAGEYQTPMLPWLHQGREVTENRRGGGLNGPRLVLGGDLNHRVPSGMDNATAETPGRD